MNLRLFTKVYLVQQQQNNALSVVCGFTLSAVDNAIMADIDSDKDEVTPIPSGNL